MKKRLVLSLILCSIFTLGLITQAQAVTWVKGDIFAALVGKVNVYDSTGTFLESYITGGGNFNTGMGFDFPGNLYVTNFGIDQVSKITGPSDPHNVSLFVNQGGNPESIARDLAGNLYISSASSGDIVKYDTSGNVLKNLHNNGQSNRADWIEINAANTKLYVTEDIVKGVQILDIATNTNDIALTNSVGNFALRLLPDGTFLVANSEDVKRLDSSGNVIQTYDISGENSWFALNLDPDGTSFWSGNIGSGKLYKFDIATGGIDNALLTINTGAGGNSLFGVAIFGEITTGGGGDGGGGGEIPEPATMILLGSGLAGLWGFRRKFKK